MCFYRPSPCFSNLVGNMHWHELCDPMSVNLHFGLYLSQCTYYFLVRFSQFSSQAKQGNGIFHSRLLQIEFQTHGANHFPNFAMFVIHILEFNKWIIMLEKCRRPDLTVFHLIWIIGTYGNWNNQNPGGHFGATS